MSADRALRDVLGRFATGVAVVTTAHRGAPVGVTVNSFTSVSLNPPLVLWCLRRESATRGAFTASRHFAVNVLAADQQWLAARFSGPGERFPGVSYEDGPHRVPLLDGVVATILCRLERFLAAGDHMVLFGAVIGHRARAGSPLLFHDGTYFGQAELDPVGPSEPENAFGALASGRSVRLPP